MIHRLRHTLTHVTVATISELMGFMGTCARATWNDRAATGAALKHHLCFHRGVPAGIQDLTGHDGVDDEIEGIEHGQRSQD